MQNILEAILEAAPLLPPQGPINKFAFLNPLQGLESRHFDDVMLDVGHFYGNQAYLDDQQYRRKIREGRISESELREVLHEDLGGRGDERVAGLTRRFDLRLAMLLHPLHYGHRRELAWVLAETEALRFFRAEVAADSKGSLIDECRDWASRLPSDEVTADLAAVVGRGVSSLRRATRLAIATMIDAAGPESVYLKLLWSVIRRGVDDAGVAGDADADADAARKPPGEPTGEAALLAKARRERFARFRAMTSYPEVDELMIRFTAAYLDQGYAATPLPAADRGYWSSFCTLFERRSLIAPAWRRRLWKELEAIRAHKWTPLEVVSVSLDQLGVDEEETPDYIAAALLSLRGFAGMIWQTEIRPDLFRKPSPPTTLIDFLAVRLLLIRLASESLGPRPLPAEGEDLPAEGEGDPQAEDLRQQAFMLFELGQLLQWTPQTLEGLTPAKWRALLNELDAFSDHQRRRIFQAALERGLAKMALRTFSVRARSAAVRPKSPWLQLVFCIDAREESLRRHIEELDPEVETFGIAGFFGVPFYYRGVGDADYSAQCPIVMQPRHWVIEEPVYSLEQSERNRARARRLIGSAQRGLRSQSTGLIGGAIVSTILGPLATIPMLSRILLPRATAMMNRTARQFIAPPSITRLRLERAPDHPAAPLASPRPATFATQSAPSPLPSSGHHHASDTPAGDEGIGFTLDEMTFLAGKSLRDIGLVSDFAPLVILLGHGSGCLNNPHESAYHCGACAGNAGGPNARALAMMLNDPRVRRNLAAEGLKIPEETFFIGGLHNTATEEMLFHDLELLPTMKVKLVREAGRLLANAALRNAQERCRRFESASLEITPEEALLHVQNRSEDLAQTRPEYGNGTNALCFVGRRSRIRGLYLDRRCFMMSYDATTDDEASTILARILSAVVPVCEGINLVYTLSAIDPIGWGSGTKLPHNVTSLIGVMDGAASDLRPGLPWQGVDIHEPVRLLFIIESTCEALLKIMAANPTIDRIFRNHWAHLAILDPHSATMHRFSKDRFVPYSPDPQLGETLPTASGSHAWYHGHRGDLPFAIITPGEGS